MDEYGIFNDEGMIEGDLWSRKDAIEQLAICYPDADCHVAKVCNDHPGEESTSCPECYDDGVNEN